METPQSSDFWWLKSKKLPSSGNANEKDRANLTSTPRIEEPSVSSSLQEFMDKERALQSPIDAEARDNTDIGSIIEEINKLAAQSPLGPYDSDPSGRSVEEIMREAEKIYLESSKSFEQLSARSRTSANLSMSLNDDSPKSTPTPKSASPLPLDSKPDEKLSYTDDFTDDEEESTSSPDSAPLPLDFTEIKNLKISDEIDVMPEPEILVGEFKSSTEVENFEHSRTGAEKFDNMFENAGEITERGAVQKNTDVCQPEDLELLKELEEEKAKLAATVNMLTVRLEETKGTLNVESEKIPALTNKLEKTLEELKDTKESNTFLQLQLDDLNKTHHLLKSSYDDVVASSGNLEKRVLEIESILDKYKIELQNVQAQRDKVLQNETNLQKLLDLEKLQTKTLKSQNEKDARCILDLTRQVKEMERIIARKHPDSVSALIVAAKKDQTDNNLSARKLLENRIKNLEEEVTVRDKQSSKVFMEVQEKFTEMKIKYESHIEDLELHVNDLKEQLKRKVDSFDVYTQTIFEDQKIPTKEGKDVSVQTLNLTKLPGTTTSTTNPPTTALTTQRSAAANKKNERSDDSHLIATIRGLQADLLNKEKLAGKLQKELNEARKTNKRLQSEREGNLKNARSYPEKLGIEAETEDFGTIKTDRDKMKIQMCRIEEDYQNLKAKRLFDLSALQQAHEDEISTYVTTVKSLREQLEMQQITIGALQEQLQITKEHLEVVTVERDDYYTRLKSFPKTNSNGNESGDSVVVPQKGDQMDHHKHFDRERRLRAIVQGLSQKQNANMNCQHCSARHQELILYKNELDQILATVRTLTYS